ncbi:hypothetical protein HDC92_005043 [Pedobacter sp. AK017]|nr:hypothetical protein [Pedobacter sp. AK017]
MDTISSDSHKSPVMQSCTTRYAIQNISEGTVMSTILYEVMQTTPKAGNAIFKLIVAAINETRVNGKFSGYHHFVAGTEIVKIKNGSFFLPVNLDRDLIINKHQFNHSILNPHVTIQIYCYHRIIF